jgi:hypothetical protein
VNSYENCQTCSSRGLRASFDGGVTYSYHCTAEVVVFTDGSKRVIKACPDFENVSRHKHGVR